jgi:general stress protein 26
MTETGDVERAWELMERVGFCMLSTWTGEKLRSRPMGALTRRKEGVIYFLTDVRAHKDDEIRQYPQVCLAYADASKQKYVSVSGSARISADRQKIKELWSTPAKAWWDGPEDPNIRLITVTPESAEYWDTPGNVLSYVSMGFAAVTGTRPSVGEQKSVAL